MENAAGLMARVRERDAGAFETLYDTHHRLVYGIAYRILGDTAAAEDVTQSVFLKIWSNPERFVDGNFSGWIARVARNQSVDVLRRRSPAAAELSESIPDGDWLEERAFSALDAEAVRNAVATLPAEQREPIELGFFGGITHAAIAQRTGIPLGTIKTRIRTGLRRLREALEQTVIA
ncbi:MAG TPA: sigma-70 family RNA polymerase sigma factor [Candidatus Rubrimentiphilum sp.]|nr:sigma-70 family RNA polymerase sigma factor [Candidatus Rubrimentiphilum sp.]